MEKLFIISNESIFENNGSFFCDNLDMKSTPESLSRKYEISIIARKSKKIRSHYLKINDTKIFSSIFTYLAKIFVSLKFKNAKYLVISISPYTFLAIIFLRIFGKIPIVYLRSDGYEEYKSIIGIIGKFIYHIMFSIVSGLSRLVSCNPLILKGKKGDIIAPSQLDEDWLKNKKQINFNKVKLLYIGRIRKEKGIFNLVNLIEGNDDFQLTIVGAEKNSSDKINQKNVNVYEIENNKQNLIKYYDDHNIFILPSYTEGHPMVLLESLARNRPVIIFEEIEHVIGDKKGIFISKRDQTSLVELINRIKTNYPKILEGMNENKLPLKKEFINSLDESISKS